jgi:hypothetical protein
MPPKLAVCDAVFSGVSTELYINVPKPRYRFHSLAIAVDHVSRSIALIEMSRSVAIAGRRIIPVNGSMKGAPVMVGGVV